MTLGIEGGGQKELQRITPRGIFNSQSGWPQAGQSGLVWKVTSVCAVIIWQG